MIELFDKREVLVKTFRLDILDFNFNDIDTRIATPRKCNSYMPELNTQS